MAGVVLGKGGSTGKMVQIYLVPRCLFQDPFRRGHHVMVCAECYTYTMQPAKGNARRACVAVMDKYADLEP